MTTDTPSVHDITCPKYARGEGKRCVHYRADGSCVLPDELMCVEWLKRNGGQAARGGAVVVNAPLTAGAPATANVPSEAVPAEHAQHSLSRVEAAREAEPVRAPYASTPLPPVPASAPGRDLFGVPFAQKPGARTARAREGAKSTMPGLSAPHASAGLGGPAAALQDAFRGLATEDIERFKALGTEVRFEAEGLGEWWLVPEPTGKPRKEITPEHAATIARVLTVFPGARIVSFERAED